jgi:hypothetical protein
VCNDVHGFLGFNPVHDTSMLVSASASHRAAAINALHVHLVRRRVYGLNHIEVAMFCGDHTWSFLKNTIKTRMAITRTMHQHTALRDGCHFTCMNTFSPLKTEANE